ncbi:hypothetical protein CKN63_13550 [Carnobacterium divergens]|uniref:hypothetical protein n=1 Tax=Carnobacterium divergens TaxID=2748 RepID=UPI001072AA3E|nr:hypothetical protein [Carnobacterium divergens]TFI60466.1 hypothetical protein CKN59_13520 [Carnobacterium divergens]TFI60498.1 hypothetical protein CKN76_13550 [Carnobacterium divergens]TFI76986.1 hypothetical protein CKN74_13170 [Carnobacterium divergens]TFJ00462.1 hypothetical protein CKN75_13385 [Carnobacterium divergens]TFJ09133.1 hypothetical protein CKN71_12500 [Carnobacterium divergens]
MNSIESYEKGDLSLVELQDHLTGIGESESLEIGSNRLCFYLQLQSDGETFDYSNSAYADWENSLSF